MDITVVVPLFNEEESLPELYAWIERVMKANDFSFEVIFVNDGSTDHSWEVIEELAEKSANVKGIKFRRNYGKVLPYSADSRKLKAMLLLQWMQTYRILRMRFLHFII